LPLPRIRPFAVTCAFLDLLLDRADSDRVASASQDGATGVGFGPGLSGPQISREPTSNYRPIVVRSVKDILARTAGTAGQRKHNHVSQRRLLAGAGKEKRTDVIMVGTRQFDHDAVVDRAMMMFWRKGYGGTSIDDLEKATRLRRGSLYNAFGDKQGLFVAALKRYETTVGQERTKQLSNLDPYRAIEGFLDILVAKMSEPSRPRGCLHTNTSLEFPNAPDEVLRIIAERTAGIEGAIYLVLRRAQAEGML